MRRAAENESSPPTHSIRSLPALTWETIATSAVAWLSNGMILPLLLVYLTAARDLSPGFAGAVLAVATITGLACQPIGGIAVDRIGPARAFAAALIITALGSLLLAVADDVRTIVVACIASGIGRQLSAATGPALLFSSVVERGQYPTASAAQYMVTNGCSGAGGLIAGFIADPDQPSTFVLLFVAQTIALSGAALLIGLRLHRRVPRPRRRLTASRRIDGNPRPSSRFTRRRFRRSVQVNGPFDNTAFRWAFGAAFLFPLVGNQQLFTGLPLHITRIGDQPTQVIGLAFAANTYTVVVIQLLALRMLHGRRRSRVAGGMFAVLSLAWSCVLLADQQTGSTQAAGFIVAAALIGLGEAMLTLTVPPVPALVAPPEQLGQYLASYSLARGSVQVLAPTMAGLLVDPLDGALLPILLASGAVISGIVVSRRARGLPAELQRI